MMIRRYPLLLLLIFFFSASTLMAQSNGKPKAGKKHPTFIKVKEKVNKNQVKQLFKKQFDLKLQDELVLVTSRTDGLGFTHDIYQQYYQGIKVEGALYSVHLKNGVVESMSGNFRDVFEFVDINPGLGAQSAFSAAKIFVGAKKYVDEVTRGGSPGELVIVADPDGINAPRLAYKCDVYASEPLSRADIFIDAHNGEVVGINPRLHETDAAATGNSLYNGNVSFTADFTGSNYRLRQSAMGNGIETYDMNNGTNYGAATDITSSGSNFTGEETGVQAHWGAEQTHSYFLDKHSRNSYDGNGAIIRSYVHYSTDYVNAFWDGQRMTYGDGDGTNYGPLVSLDIVGHEIAHGVTEYAANLVYQRESGALNESFSDIFGEAIENFALPGGNDWQMGTDIGIGGSGAIRSMDNPNAFNDPDTYGGTYWIDPNCGTPTRFNDYCGVHTNSGVQNKWFYILTVGESGTNDIGSSYNVTGIGMDKAAAIAYRNLTVYLSTSSNYADARTGAIQSAIDLYGAGSAEVIATTNAWYAVGVGGEYGTISYCNSGGTNSTYEWVASVSVGSFTYNSGAAGYSNFTGQTVNVNAGQSYSVSLSPGFSGQTYNEYWKIWIDYNADGDFDDANELAFDAGGLSSSTVNGNISIPSGASGDTRMRISMKYNGAQTSCETFTYGEVEDYTISIGGGGGGDTQPPSTPGNLTTSNITQTSAVLSWSASTDNVGVDGYRVYVNGTEVGTTATTNYSLTGLTAGTTYSIGVSAYDAASNESGQASTNVTTQSVPDTQDPSTPGNLTASNITQTSAVLSWDASTDNVGVAQYIIYIGGNLDGTTTALSYTVSGLSANTTYNMQVIAEDAAGNTSLPAEINVTTLANGGGGPTTLSASFFETGWDGWADGGSDCFRYSGGRSYEGTYSIRIRDNSGTASAMTSPTHDLTGYNQVEIEFYFYPNSMESGEDFWVRYYDGSSWNTVATYASGTSFNNNSFYVATVTLSSADYNFPSNAQFRFQCDASSNADRVYIDAVTITADNPSNFKELADQPRPKIRKLETIAILESPDLASTPTLDEEENVPYSGELSLYPNPVKNLLNVNLPKDIQQMKIMGLNGEVIRTFNTFENLNQINVSELAAGLYFLVVQTQEEVFTKRFVKE